MPRRSGPERAAIGIGVEMSLGHAEILALHKSHEFDSVASGGFILLADTVHPPGLLRRVLVGLISVSNGLGAPQERPDQ